jgi:hypothetical protein
VKSLKHSDSMGKDTLGEKLSLLCEVENRVAGPQVMPGKTNSPSAVLPGLGVSRPSDWSS